MWFKNLCPYRLMEPFNLSPEALEERLARDAFRSCERLEMTSRGWMPPLGQEGVQLVHAASGYLMLCLREESKMLPAAVIKEALVERVREIERRESRKVRKREKDMLRDEIVHDLLPRAFSRTRDTYGYIDTANGWLVVDSGNWRMAETFTEQLRASLGTLPLSPPQTAEDPQSVMTRWLAQNRLPGDVELGDEVSLEDPRAKGCEARCKRQDLFANEVKAHIESGKRVRRLALTWGEHLSCVLEADLAVKRLRFLDMVTEQSEATEAESDAQRFDTDFTIMTLELAQFLPRLVALFGGERQAERAVSA